MSVHHDDDLQRLVRKALEVLGIGFQEVGPSMIRVELDGRSARSWFGSSMPDSLWVMDRRTWEASRAGTLVVPGSRVLDGLERMLVERGASQTVVVGGELTLDPRVEGEWLSTKSFLNVHSAALMANLSFLTYARFTFEVALPEPFSSTELLPVVVSLDDLRVLDRRQTLRLSSKTAFYDLSEVKRLLTDSIPAPPSRADLKKAEDLASTRLSEELGRVLGDRLKVHTEELESRKRRFIEEHRLHVSALEDRSYNFDVDADIRRAEESLAKRMHQVQKQQDFAVSAVLRVVRVMHEGVSAPALLVRDQHGSEATFEVPRVGGQLRHDICSTCNEVRHRYFVRFGKDARLLCDHCAVACQDASCPTILMLSESAACGQCRQPLWCPTHSHYCFECGQGTCPTHGRRSDCCGQWLCADHGQRTTPEGELLCQEHGRQCALGGDWLRLERVRAAYLEPAVHLCSKHAVQLAVPKGEVTTPERAIKERGRGRLCHPSVVVESSIDGQPYLISEITSDGITNGVFHPSQAAYITNDLRMLHPASIVTVADGTLYARDKVGSCHVDGSLHVLSDLVHDDAHAGQLVCQEHGATVALPSGWWVRKSEVVREANGQRLVHVSVVATSSVSGQTFLLSELVQDGITEGLFHTSEAVTIKGRAQLYHPESIVDTVEGVRMPKNETACCAFDERVHVRSSLRPASDEPSMWLCAAHGEVVERPPEWFVHPSRVVAESAHGKRVHRSVVVQSPYDKRLYLRADLTDDPVTGKAFYRKQGVQVPGDKRWYHPESVVETMDAGRLRSDKAAYCDACSRPFSSQGIKKVTGGEEQLCSDHRVHVDHPAGAIVAMQHAQRCRVGTFDSRLYGWCSLAEEVVPNSLMHQCPISGKRFKLGHGIQFLDGEYHPSICAECPVSGKMLPEGLGTKVTCCQRRVHPVASRKLGARELCSEHVWCRVGQHYSSARNSRDCGHCEHQVCYEHAFVRPYHDGHWACRSHTVEGSSCSRCAQYEVRSESDPRVCMYCTRARPLGREDEATYRARVAPLLPLRLETARLVSGTAFLRCFHIRGVFGSEYAVVVPAPGHGDARRVR